MVMKWFVKEENIDYYKLWKLDNIDISELIGKTFDGIQVMSRNYNGDIGNYDEAIRFTCTDGSVYVMYHEQDCCEDVAIEDICGELACIIGSPITLAEVVTDCNEDADDDISCTWTFYKLGTIKGYVTIRWYGESNGYYSESVDFKKIQ